MNNVNEEMVEDEMNNLYMFNNDPINNKFCAYVLW